MTRRVVITGLGIVSCLGNDAETVSESLYHGRSGISARQEQIDIGMRSHVAGAPNINLKELRRIQSLENQIIDKDAKGCGIE